MIKKKICESSKIKNVCELTSLSMRQRYNNIYYYSQTGKLMTNFKPFIKCIFEIILPACQSFFRRFSMNYSAHQIPLFLCRKIFDLPGF